jgi:hypothetical protein
VTEFISCHTKVITILLALIVVAHISVPINCIVFATVFFGRSVTVEPAFTTFCTVHCAAHAFSQAWSCVSPDEYLFLFLLFLLFFVFVLFLLFIVARTYGPLEPADSGAA